MLSDALRLAAELLGRDIADEQTGLPEFGDDRYSPVPFTVENFHDIAPASPEASMGFVDGGNLEIFRAPDFSVQLVRVCSVIFRKGDRECARRIPSRIEFICVARAFPKAGSIFYFARTIPLDPVWSPYIPRPELLVMNSRDDELAPGRFRLDISVVGSAARRFSEWLVLSDLIRKELGKGDIAVRDGTLQTAVARETQSAGQAFAAARETGAYLTALAKTSRLFTTTGMSLLAAVGKLSSGCGREKKSWYYNPLVENNHPNHPAEIFACRLHPASRHIFRYEIFREQAATAKDAELARIFGELSSNSRDLSFPGYPYGLIEADALARVRRNEREMLRTILTAALVEKGAWDRISRHLSAVDAHDLLDEI